MGIEINKGFYYRLVRATFARRTLFRFLQNEAIIGLKINGRILDLGGSSQSQYYSHINVQKNSKIKYADLYNKSIDTIEMDFTQPFPIEDKSFDNILLFNVIEHLDNYENCIFETKRILKKNGSLYGMVPFLFPIHMVPNDFHRPTESTLNNNLSNAGFQEVMIKPIGYGRWTAAANLCGQKIKFKPIALLIYLLALLLDKFDNNKNKYAKDKFSHPMGYFFYARKM
jgi:SAM-dependent methyltransferase